MEFIELIKRLECLKIDLPTHIVEHKCIDYAIKCIKEVHSYYPPDYGCEEQTEDIKNLVKSLETL